MDFFMRRYFMRFATLTLSHKIPTHKETSEINVRVIKYMSKAMRVKDKLIYILTVISICLSSGANAQELTHEDYKLFTLALDIRKINALDIYSHSLTYNTELSEGLIGSTLVLPHKLGNSFEITTQSIFIYIDPVMVNYFSKNDWAFMIGHEFAHLLNANKDIKTIELEKLCDIHGAKYAIGAGYDLKSYLLTLAKFGDNCSPTHGCMIDRLKNLQNHFKVK